jgi:DNA-binding transcriptional regulator YiaG
MRLSKLKKLSSSEALDAYYSGRISRFEMHFSNYLRGEIGWPEYKPADVLALRQRLGLTQEAMGLLLKVSPKTVLRWETVEGVMSTTTVIALFVLDKLRDEIFDLMKDDTQQFRLLQVAIKESAPGYFLGDLLPAGDPNAPPEAFGKDEIKTLKARLGLSRREFAELLGVSVNTMDKWEGGSVIPKGPSLAILKLLWTHGADILR